MTMSGNDLVFYTDEILLQRITQSNKDALVTVFDRYAADLYRYILPLIRERQLNGHAEDHTKHVLIEVFVRLWDDRETLSINLSLSHHLFSEAHDRAVQYADRCEGAASLLQAFEQ